MIPGEKGRKASKITEIPLIPPSKRVLGKMNSTVLAAYKTLPNRISKYSFTMFIPFSRLTAFICILPSYSIFSLYYP